MEASEIRIILKDSYQIEADYIDLLREGGCKSYSVLSGSDKYFLKIIPSAFMDTAKQSIDILIYLEQKEFPSPCVIKTQKGFPYVEIDPSNNKSLFVLFEYIEGNEPEEGEDTEIIGELIGKLHRIMQDYSVKLPERGKEFFVDRYINILRKMNYDEAKIKEFQEHGNYLWKRVDSLPRGFCHGDMHRGNLLKTSTGKIYLLDFDTSCEAFPVYDIMVMCNSTNYFDYDETGFQRTKSTYETFLKGYTKNCSLSNKELTAIYDLIAIFHYQLQATVIEVNGLDCVDEQFLNQQLDWLKKWQRQCEETNKNE